MKSLHLKATVMSVAGTFLDQFSLLPRRPRDQETAFSPSGAQLYLLPSKLSKWYKSLPWRNFSDLTAGYMAVTKFWMFGLHPRLCFSFYWGKKTSSLICLYRDKTALKEEGRTVGMLRAEVRGNSSTGYLLDFRLIRVYWLWKTHMLRVYCPPSVTLKAGCWDSVDTCSLTFWYVFFPKYMYCTLVIWRELSVSGSNIFTEPWKNE